MHAGRIIEGDARSLGQLLPETVRPKSIITSPPYLDLQDYGIEGQIGFGQSHEQYFDDLRRIFAECWKIASEDATLWLVVGAVRRNGRLIQLPEMLTRLAGEAGWIPREQITWAKGKSLPWTSAGEFRDVTEQAILLSKSDQYVFNDDDLRSPDPTSVWWRRYPERYSPFGRRAANLWSIAIPTQGAWREGPGHLCPFPHELSFRLITLSSVPGDVVLDPFAGVGSIPAMAHVMGRVGYGMEIAGKYVNRYPRSVAQASEWFQQRKLELESSQRRRQVFHKTILHLRLLKFARIIARNLLLREYPVEWIYVTQLEERPNEPFKIASGLFVIRAASADTSSALESLEHMSSARPLSKFGITPVFKIADTSNLPAGTYWYKGGKFWLEPTQIRPTGKGPHLAADFRPRIEDVVEEVSDIR